jgi:N5-(cytidine 5'-diphosphoramidyl)-L-glutamine hydrolase
MKRILLSQRVVWETNYEEERDACSHDMQRFLERYSTLLFPVSNAVKDRDSYMKYVSPDLIVLSGGNSIAPELYGVDEPPDPSVSHKRDAAEMEIICFGIENCIPILGVCRGMQMLQVFFGGKLVRLANHIGGHHQIQMNDSPMELGVKETLVNSYHSMGVVESSLAAPLKAFAICEEDRTVEGIYHPDFPVVGVMWHPEREPVNLSINEQIMMHLLK